MDTRFCTVCLNKRSPPLFLRDASSLPNSRVFATYYICKEKSALQTLLLSRPLLLSPVSVVVVVPVVDVVDVWLGLAVWLVSFPARF